MIILRSGTPTYFRKKTISGESTKTIIICFEEHQQLFQSMESPVSRGTSKHLSNSAQIRASLYFYEAKNLEKYRQTFVGNHGKSVSVYKTANGQISGQ